MTIKFNKYNAKVFANVIYSEDAGRASFTKLCHGSLCEREGNKYVHCAVGEAYAWFVDRRMPRIKSVFGNYTTKYGQDAGGLGDINSKAIDELVKSAQLKNKNDKDKLADALAACMTENDRVEDDDAEGYFMARAKSVAEVWNERVVPLLK